ncbi:UbiA prenyltransferase family protein [Streptomyces sp. NPDC001177]
MAGQLFRLVRPEQWLKNVAVVPLALVDTRSWSASALGRTALAVLAFTLTSSLIYVVNDIKDRDRDRRHPVKRTRPIASGAVTTRLAVALTVMLAVGVGAFVASDVTTWWPLVAYLAINVAYSQALKHIPLIDIFCVATGFVLRLLQGYLAISHAPSQWLELCVLAFCLFLIIGKRRREITVGGVGHRPALEGYSVALVDNLLALFAVLAVMSYVLYLRDMEGTGTIAASTTLLSVPCAMFGVARHLQIMLVRGGGGDPVRSLFRDKVSVVNSVTWAALFTITVLVPR